MYSIVGASHKSARRVRLEEAFCVHAAEEAATASRFNGRADRDVIIYICVCMLEEESCCRRPVSSRAEEQMFAQEQKIECRRQPDARLICERIFLFFSLPTPGPKFRRERKKMFSMALESKTEKKSLPIFFHCCIDREISFSRGSVGILRSSKKSIFSSKKILIDLTKRSQMSFPPRPVSFAIIHTFRGCACIYIMVSLAGIMIPNKMCTRCDNEGSTLLNICIRRRGEARRERQEVGARTGGMGFFSAASHPPNGAKRVAHPRDGDFRRCLRLQRVRGGCRLAAINPIGKDKHYRRCFITRRTRRISAPKQKQPTSQLIFSGEIINNFGKTRKCRNDCKKRRRRWTSSAAHSCNRIARCASCGRLGRLFFDTESCESCERRQSCNSIWPHRCLAHRHTDTPTHRWPTGRSARVYRRYDPISEYFRSTFFPLLVVVERVQLLLRCTACACSNSSLIESSATASKGVSLTTRLQRKYIVSDGHLGVPLKGSGYSLRPQRQQNDHRSRALKKFDIPHTEEAPTAAEAAAAVASGIHWMYKRRSMKGRLLELRDFHEIKNYWVSLLMKTTGLVLGARVYMSPHALNAQPEPHWVQVL
ncbi:unnamed protein product [Trichogramma brassicae]|uniref:Uncharacterized protein n=1 Tax=Trichogramma brassicae TaxID=86971 RepID=A0A6H5HXY6_9HYME|nr:unnamed protein product [Trichogramma brassicae]